MRIQTLSVVFVMLSLLLLPVALNGCGTDTSNNADPKLISQNGIYVIGPGFRETPPVNWASSSAATTW